jgi:soluble lytic murein transglycosylase
LFFIESIPSRETRIFIERVLTNLWVYRNRLGQPTPSLDAIASGEWPVYKALDNQTSLLAGQ